MRPIVNVPEDRATDIGNTHKKFGEDCLHGSEDILSEIPAERCIHYNPSCVIMENFTEQIWICLLRLLSTLLHDRAV